MVITHKGIWEVEWLDHFSKYGWGSLESYKKNSSAMLTCKSVGYLVYEDKNVMTLVQSLGEDNVADSIVIMKKLILSKVQLGVPV